MSENLFRIGGVYRNGAGDIVRLQESITHTDFPCVSKYVEPGRNPGGASYHRLSDGMCFSQCNVERYSLLPGELHCVNGEWVPIDSDAELLALQTRPQHVEAICIASEERECSIRGNVILPEEIQRPPLPGYGQRTPFDPFKGYAVSHLTSEYIAPPFAGLSLDGPSSFRAPRSL